MLFIAFGDPADITACGAVNSAVLETPVDVAAADFGGAM